MEPPPDFVERLNRIEWRSRTVVSPEAEALVQEHLTRLREVIHFLVDTRGLTPSDAYAVAQSGGHASARYNTLLDKLFHRVAFRGVGGVREALILSLASGWSWELDPDLQTFKNPWEPLLALYELGYTSTFEEAQDGRNVDLVLGLKDGEKLYSIV